MELTHTGKMPINRKIESVISNPAARMAPKAEAKQNIILKNCLHLLSGCKGLLNSKYNEIYLEKSYF